MIRISSTLVLMFLLSAHLQGQEVTDTVEPQIRIRDAVVYLDIRGQVRISPDIFDNGSKDNSGRVTLSTSRTAFGCSDAGDHNILLTASDESGNTANAMALLTVKDTIPPDVITRNQVVKLDPSGRISPDPALFDYGSTDACGIRGMSIEPATFSCSDVGSHRIMFTVTDRNGNSASMPVLATVFDATAPDILTRNVTVELNAEGTASVDPEALDYGSTDLCGIKNILADPSIFGCRNLGENTVRLTATDRNGNTSVAEVLVTVVDLLPPMALARDMPVQLDENGMAYVKAEDIDAGSSDNCGISSMSVEPSVFDCSNTGKHTITLTVTDRSGNKAVAEAFVIVEDNIPPVLTTEDLRLYIDQEGKVVLPAKLIDKWSRDACGTASVVPEVPPLGCSDIGTKEVLIMAKDNNGNTSSKPVKVTIIDNIPPEVRTRDITVKLDEQGIATFEPADINNESTDNCAIGSMTVDSKGFTREQMGKNEVELTVVDTSGNKSTGKAVVTVVSE